MSCSEDESLGPRGFDHSLLLGPSSSDDESLGPRGFATDGDASAAAEARENPAQVAQLAAALPQADAPEASIQLVPLNIVDPDMKEQGCT